MHNETIIATLKEIVSNIELILNRTENIDSAQDFLKNDDSLEKFDSVSMRLQVIGELIKNINKHNPDLFLSYPEIEWRQIMKLRDIISHHYIDIDVPIIFDICQNDIPKLKTTIEKIITDLENK